MIHCVCRQINTAKVDQAASCGAKTANCVMKFCGTRFNCGQCRTSIDDRLQAVIPTLGEDKLLAAE
ncbi:(2Fe-2S)-binding protein [Litorimonas sp. WD9-15]|uniref:(2Fe-2S)-binding protein n=1 Tax=Litorimonas sp. WD9-15 TaxID=3418716 RepID=UPI003D042641